MKKVLILAYDFPPFVSVGGLRPYNWYKYFSEYGFYPIVVTRQWSNEHGNELDYVAPGYSTTIIVEESEEGTILRTPYRPNLSNRLLLKYGPNKFKLGRKLITGFFEVLQFHFNVGPKLELYKAAKHYLQNNRADVIIATGDPFVLFRYAANLSKEFDIPWVADYRDPWSQGLFARKRSILSILQRFNEKRFVSNASIITTVDELFQTKIGTILPDHHIEIIPNGYDPEGVQDALSVSQKNDKLRLALVGTIYKWHPIRHFLETFKTFLSQVNSQEVEIHFIGTNINEVLQKWCSPEDLNIESSVVISPRMPNQEILKTLSQFNVMLLFNYYEFTGTKIYDYIALNRRILFCFTDDPVSAQLKELYYFKEANNDLRPQEKIIKKHNAGIIVKDANELSKALLGLYQEYKKHGEIKCNTQNIEFYSRKFQAGVLADHLNSIIKKEKSS